MDRGSLARLDPERFPAPRQRRADHRSIDAVRDQVRAYALDEHVPRIGRLLDRVERRGRERDLQELRDVITPYVTFHERDYPFAVAPPGVLEQGELPVLQQLVDDQPLCITRGELAQGGVLLIGSSGTGKTTILLHLIERALDHGLHVWIVDPKDDARHLVRTYPNLLVLDSHAPINLLAQPPYLSRAEHLANIEEAIARAMYGGQTVRAVLHEALTKTYETTTDPTFLDLIATLEHLARKGDTYQRVDAIRNTLQRLRRLIERYPGLAMRNGLAPHELCDKSLLLPILEYSDLEDVLVTYLTRVLFQHHRTHRITELTHLITIDEALLAVREDHQRIGGNPITELHAMTREYGIAWAISVNSITLTDPQLRNNAYLQIALNLHSSDDATLVARTFGLTPAEAEYHRTKLTRGQAIARLGDRWRRPILCTFAPSTTDKRVDQSTWADACTRIARLVPPLPAESSLAAREEHESNGLPTPTQTAAPSSSPPPRVAPVVEEPVSPNAKKIPLNKHATTIIEDVAAHPYTLTTPCFTRSGLRLSEGDRGKTTLVEVGFLESHRVRTGTGRGKTGSALKVSLAGWQWLDRAPPKGTRGGDSVQHAFTVHELHRRIPRSTIETLSADLVIVYNAEEHERLHRAIEELSARAIALNDGDVIALEVECSRPELTARRSVERDTGFALTIIAALGKTDELRRTFGEAERVLILDVLRLLDALHATEDA